MPGTDLRAGVPTMPYLLLKAEGDADAIDLAARIDEGVALIADGADPAILDGPLDALRDRGDAEDPRARARVDPGCRRRSPAAPSRHCARGADPIR